MDEEDSILEEIPVYLSKTIAPNLYVIQFPIKNKIYSLDKSGITNCCVKPVAQQLKIDFQVNTASRNYDAFKGKVLAELADGNKPSVSKEHPTFDSGRMDKVSFVSSISVQDPRYALGMMQDKELHLVPIKTFMQMRQTFSYFDKGDKRTKAEQKAENGSDDEAENLKQVTVKFARAGDQERIKKARERSYNFISQIGADEPWCETLIYSKDTHQSEMERQKIPHAHQSNEENCISITPKEYFSDLFHESAVTLNSVTPSTSSDTATDDPKEVKIPTVRDPLSKKQVKKLPLLDQIKMFLKDAKVLPFNQLIEMLSDPQLSAEKVLRNLLICGVMLRGNWTLQSDFIYPAGVVSLVNGISADLMCRGRDYVLYKIMKNELLTLNRQKISTITQLPLEETREVVESVACLKPNRTWDLLRPPDFDFEQKHPEIVHRQEAFWKAQEEKLLEMEAEKNEKRVRKKSVRESKA